MSAQGPIAVDLFSGAGGLSLGLEKAGYTVVLAVDHDPAAVQTHLGNFAGASLDMDLSDPDRVDDLLSLLSGLSVDLVAGGPPCQPFSRAGRSKIRDLVVKGIRDPIDPRKELWRVFLRVVEEVAPRAVLMENVPDMALGDDMRMVRFMADRLESVGYETDMRILEAWRYGVPQHRQRMIFVGYREGVFEWPKDREQVTLRQAINDLPSLGASTGSVVTRYGVPKSDFQRAARADVPLSEQGFVYDHFTRPVRSDDLEAFKLMKSGTRYSDLPSKLKRYRDDIFDDKYHRLAWDSWCRSITAHIAKDGYWYIHPAQQRTLTVREAARIQTFPDNFRFAGSRSDAFRLIGNAVPPRLGEVIGVELLAVRERPVPSEQLSVVGLRRELRNRLLGWSSGPKPAWRRTGDAWAVLVGTVAGRRRHEAAEGLLDLVPDPAALTAVHQKHLDAGLPHTLDPLRLLRVIAAAKAVRDHGWDDEAWVTAAKFRATEVTWVETVGLGQKHLAATAGMLRVAVRLAGRPDVTGVPARVLLGQLVGHGESSNDITASIAGLAEVICRPTAPRCGRCPLQDLCPSSGNVGATY